MNTPAHVVINLLALTGAERRRFAMPVLLGALLPDLPMFAFYLWQRLAGAAESHIWSVAYFAPPWQAFFDWFNSIPLALLGLGIAWRMRAPVPGFFCASLLLHLLLDLPLHHEDAHRHFYPFSDWRFASPVSYWNPAHHGRVAALAEAFFACLSCGLLWRRYPARVARTALAGVPLLYLAAFTALSMGAFD